MALGVPQFRFSEGSHGLGRPGGGVQSASVALALFSRDFSRDKFIFSCFLCSGSVKVRSFFAVGVSQISHVTVCDGVRLCGSSLRLATPCYALQFLMARLAVLARKIISVYHSVTFETQVPGSHELNLQVGCGLWRAVVGCGYGAKNWCLHKLSRLFTDPILKCLTYIINFKQDEIFTFSSPRKNLLPWTL